MPTAIHGTSSLKLTGYFLLARPTRSRTWQWNCAVLMALAKFIAPRLSDLVGFIVHCITLIEKSLPDLLKSWTRKLIALLIITVLGTLIAVYASAPKLDGAHDGDGASHRSDDVDREHRAPGGDRARCDARALEARPRPSERPRPSRRPAGSVDRRARATVPGGACRHSSPSAAAFRPRSCRCG